MAIAFDAATNNGTCGASSPITWSHTCTGNNLILFVTAYTGAGNDNVTAVSYNSVALTKITSQVSAGSTAALSLWYLFAPATGTHTVSVTFSSSPGSGHAVSYTGALQSSVPDSFNSGTAAGGGTLTVSTTTVKNNCWLTGGFIVESNDAGAGANTTIRNYDVDGTHHTGGCGGTCDSNVAETPAGSFSLAITGTARTMAVASFAPIIAISGTDTEVTSDSVSLASQALINTNTDTEVTSDSAKLNIGWNNQSKSSTTWTNQSKT